MKNKLVTLGLSAFLASGCARIPIAGKLYNDLLGDNGISSYQYLQGEKRNFLFTFDSFEYYDQGNNIFLPLNKLELTLENAIKISEGNFQTLAITNLLIKPSFRLGHYKKSSFVEGKISVDENLIMSGRFNYYYFKIDNKVMASGKIE